MVLEAPVINLAGSIQANGGGGASGDGAVNAQCSMLDAGKDGSDGQDGAAPAQGGPPAAYCSGAGGQGGATGTVDGTNGASANSNGNGGGGGGAGGRIILRSALASEPGVPIHPAEGLKVLPLVLEP